MERFKYRCDVRPVRSGRILRLGKSRPTLGEDDRQTGFSNQVTPEAAGDGSRPSGKAATGPLGVAAAA